MVGTEGAMKVIDMRTNLAILVCVLTIKLYANTNTIPQNFFRALNQVEAGGRSGPIRGDNGTALGPMQIHYSYWLDAHCSGSYSNCADFAYSCRVVNTYLLRYCPKAVACDDFETMARIHNGGPRGDKKEATKSYWKKVRKQLTKPQT